MAQINVKNRTIFCLDNLHILRNINSASVDLIYMDPPFNKKKLFTAPIGSSAEGASFKDWFNEQDIKADWLVSIAQDNEKLFAFLNGVKKMEGKTSYNFCYLAYISMRLIECHRILKPTGSLYLHCDPTMSHYLKIVLDCIFQEANFQNEIIWNYFMGGKSTRFFARKHDVIFFYAKNANWYFKIPLVKRHLDFKPTLKDTSQDGVLTHDDLGYWSKVKCPDVWSIKSVFNMSKEYVGYPTQKPVKLLERIISASCPEKGIVLDPFCGCATACIVAEQLNRQWIGIDISVKAYELVKARLAKECAQGTIFEPARELYFQVSPPQRSDQNGDTVEQKWVYVISNPAYLNEYKVGVAKNYKTRLNAYQTSDPNRQYKMEYKKLVANFNEVEQKIHQKFPNRHEWIQADLKDIIAEINILTSN